MIVIVQVGFQYHTPDYHEYFHEWSATGNAVNLDDNTNCAVTGRFIYRIDGTAVVPFDEGNPYSIQQSTDI